jgi:hypothetical protein
MVCSLIPCFFATSATVALGDEAQNMLITLNRPCEYQSNCENVKLLPLLVVTATAMFACANQPMPPDTRSVGQSQQPPGAVAQCIAQKWADRSQQQVISQAVLANNQAMDVYVPGRQPPNGAAAVVRPAWTANSKTWVGFRASGGLAATPPATSVPASRPRASALTQASKRKKNLRRFFRQRIRHKVADRSSGRPEESGSRLR